MVPARPIHRPPSMLSSRVSRRTALLSLLPFAAAQAQPLRRALATPIVGVLQHRGFTLRIATSPVPDRPALEAAMKHQLDIVADCGVKPEILALWRTIPLTLVRGGGEPGGNFKPGRGAQIYATLPPPANPVVLHELIHALHYRYLPQSTNNPDIERFYRIAIDNTLYPQGSYVLKNRNEFFAVTGSLYLWGKVAVPPHDRATLFAKQPRYYEWLGELFGVKKNPQAADG